MELQEGRDLILRGVSQSLDVTGLGFYFRNEYHELPQFVTELFRQGY